MESLLTVDDAYECEMNEIQEHSVLKGLVVSGIGTHVSSGSH